MMELFILNKINKIAHINKYSLYRDDGLMIVPDNKKSNDKIRKMLFKVFHDLKFSITVEMKKKYVQHLEVEFNLTAGSVSPHLKPNTIVKYINVKFNNPPSIIKHISKGTECRLSRNSLTKDIL